MPIQVIPTSIPDVLVIQPSVYGDQRGYFYESFNQKEFNYATGVQHTFVQDNQSYSKKGVLRGLHYQLEQVQGKLVRVMKGEVFDVAVDMRSFSKTFGQHVTQFLSAENKKQLWIPPGFAHGFLVLSDDAEFAYKTTDYWHPQSEKTLLWDDPNLGISWPNTVMPSLNEKDSNGLAWASAPKFNEDSLS